jgi:ribosomal protein S18 acetylase RimI-like enzyme
MTARHEAMPYLPQLHDEADTRDYFAREIMRRPDLWWTLREGDQVTAYMLIDGEHLDHLYVLPGWQGCGLGSVLLNKAKSLSPRCLRLKAFQRNARARAFYEARGFCCIGETDGKNEEGEPDVLYEWRGAA